MEIYVRFDSKEHGPYTKSEVFALMKQGVIPPDARGRLGGDAEWKSINEVLVDSGAGFFSVAEIASKNEELPATPIIVPEFQISRPKAEVPPPKERRSALLWPAAIAVVACLILLVSRIGHRAEDTAQPTAEASPTPELRLPPKRDTLPSPTPKADVAGNAAKPAPKITENPSVSPPPAKNPEQSPEPNRQPVVAAQPERPPEPVDLPIPAPTATPQTVENETPPAPPVVSEPQKTETDPPKIDLVEQKAPPATESTNRINTLTNDFFLIGSVKYWKKQQRNNPAVYKEVVDPSTRKKTPVFLPCLEIKLRTQKELQASTTYLKAYFYDRSGRQIAKAEPYPVSRGEVGKYPLPALFKKEKWESAFFVIPDELKNRSDWRALVVFGDSHSADAKVYPGGNYTDFAFPERQAVQFPEHVDRKDAMDPIVEHVVKTRNPKQPQITLFLRPPIGMTDASEAKGVLALCAIGDSVLDLKRRLQTADVKDDLSWVLKFAEKHQLIILCWGSRSLWDPHKNWNELSKAEQKDFDDDFEQVSRAWAQGVEDLAKKYGIPDRDFLLNGSSGAAQYAARLALKQPRFFQAVYVHIPSSFDRPTLEASRILWCLTTGELEPGYNRSLKFYRECREMGYPILYKAIVGLGHQGSPYADRIGEAFFEWALSEEEERGQMARDTRGTFFLPIKAGAKSGALQPWPQAYRTPESVGDIVNQAVFPWDERDQVPKTLQVPLPTTAIANAWGLQKP